MSVDPFDFSDSERAHARTLTVSALLQEGLLADAFAPAATDTDAAFLDRWCLAREDVLDVVDGRIREMSQRRTDVDCALAGIGDGPTDREIVFVTRKGVTVACAVSADQRDVVLVVGPDQPDAFVFSTQLASVAELVREIGHEMLLRADLALLAAA